MDETTSSSGTSPHKPSFARWTVVGIAVACVFLVVGFYRFANAFDRAQGAGDRIADAIVVLTGGTARVETGLQLLAKQRGKRLLISGVNPATTVKQIIKATKAPKRLFTCCVDLDRAAQNTEGNALEAARWASKHGFDSLILVTSAYHMPRSLVEFGNALPGTKLIPHVVRRTDQQWWRNPKTFGLFTLEYSKYLLAWARIGVFPGEAASQLANANGTT